MSGVLVIISCVSTINNILCRLVALVETLQKRKLRHNKRPQSQPHALENITIALDAIQEDGIKLVNIGRIISIQLLYISEYSASAYKTLE